MSIPRSVKVGPFTYTIERRDDLPSTAEADGCCTIAHQKILIAPHLKGEFERSVLLHEVLHAAYHAAGLDEDLNHVPDAQREESIVARLSIVLLSVLRDNPSLVRHLTAADAK